MGKGYLIEKFGSLSSVNIEQMPMLKINLMTHGKQKSTVHNAVINLVSKSKGQT